MCRHALSVLLCPLFALVGRLPGDDRDRLILALRQQVLILQRQLGKRPSLTRSERLALGSGLPLQHPAVASECEDDFIPPWK